MPLAEVDQTIIGQGDKEAMDSPTSSALAPAPTQPASSSDDKSTAVFTKSFFYNLAAASFLIVIWMAVVYRPKCQSQPDEQVSASDV